MPDASRRVLDWILLLSPPGIVGIHVSFDGASQTERKQTPSIPQDIAVAKAPATTLNVIRDGVRCALYPD